MGRPGKLLKGLMKTGECLQRKPAIYLIQ